MLDEVAFNSRKLHNNEILEILNEIRDVILPMNNSILKLGQLKIGVFFLVTFITIGVILAIGLVGD